jgi:hypothetical protein
MPLNASGLPRRDARLSMSKSRRKDHLADKLAEAAGEIWWYQRWASVV